MTKDKSNYYLFLDVDGVLHPMDLRVLGMTREEMNAALGPGNHSISEVRRVAAGRKVVNESKEFLSRLSLLEKTIRPHLQKITIIISTTWRLHPPSLQGLLDCMSEDVRARVVGTTHQRHGDADDNRPNEIVWWLNKHEKLGVKVIALNDHPSPWPGGIPSASEPGSRLT
ncbi:MAG: hypothetical protein KGO02_16805 [Alphaproteobacteria bacterium]|nr:hypothetical protein [Alphaproteobacteria bacterium]